MRPMKKKARICIIGTGLSRDDVPARGLQRIAEADILIGGRRQLALFPDYGGDTITVGKNAAQLVGRLGPRLAGRRTVVLASGDPNFYGIAVLFYEHFPLDHIEILPNVTAFQAAFARIREPWQSAVLLSVHGRPLSVLDRVAQKPGMYVVYCDAANTPAAVAAYLIAGNGGLAGCRTWVFDSLGTSGERIVSGTLRRMQRLRATPLCLMIIKSDISRRPLPLGIPDELFAHDRAMITRSDVRLLALARLELSDGLVLWDLGAGSGSVAIEAARACPGLQAWAVEKNDRRFRQLQANIRRLCAPNVHPVAGDAPAACGGLPRPDRIFIGGSGGDLAAVMTAAKKAGRGGLVMVVNCVTMDSLAKVLELFQTWQWPYEVTSVATARLISGSQPEMLRPDTPVFIVQGRAPLAES